MRKPRSAYKNVRQVPDCGVFSGTLTGGCRGATSFFVRAGGGERETEGRSDEETEGLRDLETKASGQKLCETL